MSYSEKIEQARREAFHKFINGESLQFLIKCHCPDSLTYDCHDGKIVHVGYDNRQSYCVPDECPKVGECLECGKW